MKIYFDKITEVYYFVFEKKVWYLNTYYKWCESFFKEETVSNFPDHFEFICKIKD